MASCVLALCHSLPLQSPQSPTRAGSALSMSLWGLWDSLGLAQPSIWALKETARSIQGLEKPPLHLGFGGEALEDGTAQPQQNTGETTHPDGPKPFKLLQWKVYFAQMFPRGWVIPSPFLGAEVGLSDGLQALEALLVRQALNCGRDWVLPGRSSEQQLLELPQNTPGSLSASIPSSVSPPGLPKAYCCSLGSFCCLARIPPAPYPCRMIPARASPGFH